MDLFEVALLPSVERLVIQDVGPIRQADVRFSAGLNFICGEGGIGKTTLLRSIVVGVCNHLRTRDFLAYAMGTIQLEFRSKLTRCHLSTATEPDDPNLALSEGAIPLGRATFDSLTQAIANLTEDFALLFDEEMLSAMDLSLLTQAFRSLSIAKGQVIGVLPRHFSRRDIEEWNLTARLIQTKRHPGCPADSRSSVEITDI